MSFTSPQEVLAHLAAIIESSHDAILSKSLTGIVTSWNPEAVIMFGYLPEEIIGKSITILFPPDRLEEEELILSKIRAGQRVDRFQTVRLRKDGTPVEVSATISPIRDSNGVINGVSKILRDITAKNDALRRITALGTILDRARDAIVVRNLDGIILFWNEGAERIYGWTKVEVLDKQFPAEAKFSEICEAILTFGEWTGELQQVNKMGTPLTVESRWTLIRDEAGHPKSLLTINTDITEKRKVEAQFMRAQRMESIGTLASGVAHDLNNILAPIILSSGYLKELAFDEDTLELLEIIDSAARRGSSVVQQVLLFGRGISKGQVEVDPIKLLMDIERIIKESFPKNIILKTVYPSNIWGVMADSTQIHQVLLNLCLNARDAMPGGGTLQLSCENAVLDAHFVSTNHEAKTGPYLIITVTDSGSGIEAKVLEKIFEPFFTTKEIGQGTGLGLSTVAAIVRNHKGFTRVFSEVGRGTTFKVYLPALASSRASQEVTQIPFLAPGNKETILVVDDEAFLLAVMKQALQAFGYHVLTAVNGAEAISIYAKQQREIDLIITDIMMPVLDGIAAIDVIKRINPKVKIIVTSGLNSNEAMAKMDIVGVRHFIAKPCTIETLLKTLKEVLNSD